MLKAQFRSTTMLLLSFALIGLAACGSPTPRATDATRTATSVVASTSGPSTQPVALTRQYDDIAQSKTPEGYYVLGSADAPITIKHYSDFL